MPITINPNFINFETIDIFSNSEHLIELNNDEFEDISVTITMPEGFEIYDFVNNIWVSELTIIVSPDAVITNMESTATGNVNNQNINSVQPTAASDILNQNINSVQPTAAGSIENA